MSALASSDLGTFLPLAAPVETRSRYKSGNQQIVCCPVRVSVLAPPFYAQNGHRKLMLSDPVTQLRTFKRRINSNRKHSASITCAAAMNVRCAASGQTQTITRESPVITKAPLRETNKTPRLDDGRPGFPPRHDGGGGGRGGGGNFSGGFFLFGFLGFLGYLKDLENEHSRESRMR